MRLLHANLSGSQNFVIRDRMRRHSTARHATHEASSCLFFTACEVIFPLLQHVFPKHISHRVLRLECSRGVAKYCVKLRLGNLSRRVFLSFLLGSCEAFAGATLLRRVESDFSNSVVLSE